jgi:hypothetical protein
VMETRCGVRARRPRTVAAKVFTDVPPGFDRVDQP